MGWFAVACCSSCSADWVVDRVGAAEISTSAWGWAQQGALPDGREQYGLALDLAIDIIYDHRS